MNEFNKRCVTNLANEILKKRTKTELSRIIGITRVTLNNRLKDSSWKNSEIAIVSQIYKKSWDNDRLD